MPFIQFQDSEHFAQGQKYFFEKNRGVTALQTQNEVYESAIFSVDFVILLELEDNGIPYQQIQESDLQQKLSEKGYELYQFLKENRPEDLYFNKPLPPFGYIEVFFCVEETQESIARNILETYRAEEIKTRKETFADLSGNPDLTTRIMMFAHVKENLIDNVVSELTTNHIAGYDRFHKFYRSGSPDRL